MGIVIFFVIMLGALAGLFVTLTWLSFAWEREQEKRWAWLNKDTEQ